MNREILSELEVLHLMVVIYLHYWTNVTSTFKQRSCLFKHLKRPWGTYITKVFPIINYNWVIIINNYVDHDEGSENANNIQLFQNASIGKGNNPLGDLSSALKFLFRDGLSPEVIKSSFKIHISDDKPGGGSNFKKKARRGIQFQENVRKLILD